MSTDIVLRVADVREALELATIQRRVALHAYARIFPSEAPPPTLEQLAQGWRDAIGGGSVAFIVGHPTGVALAGPDSSRPAMGHLSRLYVDPAHWGNGIGRALHDACLDHLRETGFTHAALWVLERNERARAWYERLGWTATGERKPVYEPARIDDVRYERTL